MDDELKFTWIWSKYDPRGYERENFKITPLQVVSIKDMNPFFQDDWEKGYKNRIQMATSKQRVIKETSYDLWNGCIFIDIDYKNWIKTFPNNYIPPIEILNNVWNYLKANYCANTYYAELSRSNLGFHFIFYYDCEHTKENFDYYTAYTKEIIANSFEECGYCKVIHFKGVFDDCSKSFCQCCYLTRNEERFNVFCTGELVKYEDVVVKKNQMKSNTTNKSENKWVYEIKSRNDDIEQVEYIEHYTRWRLFNSLAMICKDEEMLKREWERCAKMIPEQNGHDTRYYIDVPYRICDWFDKLSGNEYVDTELLKRFGYELIIKPQIKLLKSDLMNILELL